MSLLNLKGAFRALRKNRWIHILNMGGLAVALTAALLIYLWVQDELSFDRFHPDAQQIYRIGSTVTNRELARDIYSAPEPLAKELKTRFPEVEEVLQMLEGRRAVLKKGEYAFDAQNLYYSSAELFDFFAFPLISGREESLRSDPFRIFLSEGEARRLYGEENPIGKTLLLDTTYMLTISGILKDPPHNTHLQIDYLLPLQLLEVINRENYFDRWNTHPFMTYVKLREGADPAAFESKLAPLMDSFDASQSRRFFIQPLKDLHLMANANRLKYKSSMLDLGPKVYILLFSITGFLLLLIACINFIQISLATSVQRQKEMGLRKISGAGRRHLLRQIFGESFLQILLSFLLALLLLIISLPLFSQLTGKPLDAGSLLKLPVFTGMLGILLFTGIISGLYPAVLLSVRMPVHLIHKTTASRTGKPLLRKILVVSQFTIVVIFLTCLMVIHSQLQYMKKKEYGFSHENVLMIYPGKANASLLQEEIEQTPGVKGTAVSNQEAINTGNNWLLRKWDGNTTQQEQFFHMVQVDEDYLQFMGLHLVQGRFFSRDRISVGEVIVNETAVKKLGYKEPLGKRIWKGQQPHTIVGVVKDFHYRSMEEEIYPIFYYQSPKWYKSIIYARLEAERQNEINAAIMSRLKKSNPQYPPETVFLDEEIGRFYQSEQSLSQLLTVSGILILMVSLVGLFGITALSVGQRIKEAGIRKVHGASTGAIAQKYNWDFLRLVLIANLLAWPLAWYLPEKWLNNYAYHVDMNLLFPLMSLLIVMLISLLTINFQTLKAANTNPANVLREE